MNIHLKLLLLLTFFSNQLLAQVCTPAFEQSQYDLNLSSLQCGEVFEVSTTSSLIRINVNKGIPTAKIQICNSSTLNVDVYDTNKNYIGSGVNRKGCNEFHLNIKRNTAVVYLMVRNSNCENINLNELKVEASCLQECDELISLEGEPEDGFLLSSDDENIEFKFDEDTLPYIYFGCQSMIDYDELKVDVFEKQKAKCFAEIATSPYEEVCQGTDKVIAKGKLFTHIRSGTRNIDFGIEGAEFNPLTGEFLIDSIYFQSDYELRPKRTDEVSLYENINVLDIIHIQNHILGFRPFTTAMQFKAADVDANGKINVADMLAIRNLLLRYSDNLGESENHHFFIKYDSLNSDVADQIENEIIFNTGADPLVEVNIAEVKLGDISSWQEKMATSRNAAMYAIAEKEDKLEFELNSPEMIGGLELTFEVVNTPELYQFNRNLDISHYEIDGIRYLKVLHFEDKLDDYVKFTLSNISKDEIKLVNSRLVSRSRNVISLVEDVLPKDSEVEVEVLPANSSLTVSLKKDTNITFELFDIIGTHVGSFQENLLEGTNTVTIPYSLTNNTVYLLRVNDGDKITTHKFVKL